MSSPWQVWLASPPYAALTYLCPDWIAEPGPGLRVLVPLGRSLRVGILEKICEAPAPGIELKPMLWPLEQAPVLDDALLALVRELASRHMAHPGRVLEVILPRGLRSSQVSFQVEHKDFRPVIAPRTLLDMAPERLMKLAEVWAEGRMRVKLSAKRQAEELYVSLAVDPPWPVRPGAVRQIELLEHLFDQGALTLGAVGALFGDPGKLALKKLAQAGLVRLGEEPDATEENESPEAGILVPVAPVDMMIDEDDTDGTCPVPQGGHAHTDEQQAVLEALLPKLSGGFSTALVHGVTGSGKTHVYLTLARRALELGRSVILLAPEVALSCQLWRQAKAALENVPGAELYFSHGYLSPRRREAIFSKVAAARGPVVLVGTRSALFLPVREVGLIVLDEEHDESYKQEERLAYHAKELAYSRAQKSGGLLVLGSATPDLKTFHAAKSGAVPLFTLSRRVGCRPLPAVRLVDIGHMKDPDEPFAPETAELLKSVLDAGDQAIVMLNRRGYAPAMYCMACEEVAKCPDCQVGLTYHKGRERLVCHYCGLSQPYPMTCGKCGSTTFVPMGEGTERLEEYFPRALGHEVGVLRMDRDSARRQERLEDILRRFSAQEAQVLVGTQMLSKGHHFPGVTLVIVANADMGLNLPDYRAAERTFQLLVQVSGRAGRGEKPGEVVIQTRNPGHPFWDFVLRADYNAFAERELAQRQRFGYPPFRKLALLRATFPVDFADFSQALTLLAKALREAARPLGVDVLGPAPAPLAMLAGRRRFHCLLKCDSWQPIRALIAGIARDHAAPGSLRLELDLDPVNML